MTNENAGRPGAEHGCTTDLDWGAYRGVRYFVLVAARDFLLLGSVRLRGAGRGQVGLPGSVSAEGYIRRPEEIGPLADQTRA